MAVALLARCGATSKSRPKCEASRYLAGEVASKVDAGEVGRDF